MDDVSGVGASQMDEAVPVERFLAPASAAQARIALVEQIEACAGAFNLAVMLTVRGPVRPDLLRGAFDGLIDRHEILRTNIVRDRNEFLQAIRISGSEPPPFETTLVEATAEQIKSDFLIRARRPFDLAQDWLIQASWRPEADGVGHLLIVLHHVLADAMSLPVLLRDFMALYQAASLGQASPLPELALHHADYAHWERGERSSSTEDDLEYWRLTLTDSPGAIALPSRPRPRRQSFKGEMLERALPAGCSAAVAALARGCGATPAAVYLAAFAMALRSRASQTDLPLGVPYSARDRAEISDLVGPLLNVLVLRLRLEPEMTFRELVVHASQVMREGQGRQAARFEEIVDRIGGSRDLGRPPLFNVMYAYEHGSQDEFRVGDAHFEIDRLFNGGAKYDLTIYVTDELAGGRFALEWASLLFDADDIARFADGFVAGLQAGLEAPASRLDALPTVGEGEQAEIDAICVGEPAPACAALAEQLLSGLRRRPDADALTCGAETWTFGQLEDRIAAIAAGLAQAVEPGRDRVAIFSRPTMEAVASILASLLAGVPYVPVDPDMPPGRIQAVLEDADCRLLLLSEADRDRAPASIEQRLFSNTGEGTQLFEEFRDDTATAYLIYTSGSTGTPKGVVVSRANLAAFLAAMDTTVPIPHDSVWLASTTISFDIAVLELIWTLSRGVHVVLADSELFVERPARRGPVVQPALSLFFFGAFEDQPQRGRYGPLLEAARLADEAGLSAVWLPERHFDPFGGAFPSPAVLGAAVGAVTSKISIRAGSVVLPLHDPIRVAEDWAVIDQLTDGRAGLSLASGWHAQDFVLEPDAYVQRRLVLRERLEIIRRLWRGERICRPGPDGTSFDIEIFPKPLKGGIPVWLTSSGAQETFQEAGQLGLGLLTHLLGQSIDDLEDKLRLYRAARSNTGEEERGSAAVMLHTYLAADGAEARARATAPLRRYLRSSLPLLGSLLRGLGHDQDLGQIGGDRLDAIVNMAADRFLSVNGMIGSPREAARMVGALSEIGVDEVACFIDFGIDSGAVLDSVRRIAELRSSLGAGGAETISRCAFAELVERHDVTHFQATPSLLRLLLRAAGGKRALSRLQTLLVGGEALDAATAEALRSAVKGHLLNMYGPTEATVWCCSHPVEAGEGPPPIGTPVPGMAVAVLDAWRQQTPIGALGELRIVGPQVAQGYHLRPEASALFRRADDGRVSYDSGDLVSLRTGDGLIFHGRADRQIKIAGHRLELGEIDAHLKRQPGIADAACVAIPTKTGERASSLSLLRKAVAASSLATLPQTIPCSPAGSRRAWRTA